MSAVLFEDAIEIPAGIRGLRDFQRWVLSASFPERGRIDFISGKIEVDMSPEQFFSHGGPKEALARTLGALNFELKLGYLRVENTRVTSISAGLSAEPDLIFLSKARLEQQEITFTSSKADAFLEVQGGPDVVVEIVSPSSVIKDTRRLPASYFAAGVLEYWLVDARQEDGLKFQIHRRGKSSFQRVRADADGYQKSTVFGTAFRLHRERDKLGYWEFELQSR